MYLTFFHSVTTCFGHVSFDNAPRISDALSELIDRAPEGVFKRYFYVKHFRAPQNAGRYLARAWRRIGALAEALDARKGAHLSQEFADATKGATLLIGADLIAAILVDPSQACLDKVTSALSVAFPETDMSDLYRDFTCDVVGSQDDADAILSISGKAFEREFPAVAAWYRKTVATPLTAQRYPSAFLNDVADARHQLMLSLSNGELFEPLRGRTIRAHRARAIAGAIGAQMYHRTFTAHRAPVIV